MFNIPARVGLACLWSALNCLLYRRIDFQSRCRNILRNAVHSRLAELAQRGLNLAHALDLDCDGHTATPP